MPEGGYLRDHGPKNMKRTSWVVLAVLLILAIGSIGHRVWRGWVKHSVTLTWQRPASANGSTPLRYNIYRSDDAGRSYLQIANRVGETTYLDGSVESGKSYRYVVTSIDGTGHESVRSGAIDVSVP
jgi:hypothetical protein